MENNQSKNKNSKDIIALDEIIFKQRLYTFFFASMERNDISLILSAIFIFIETFQLISFAFSDLFINTWKLDKAFYSDFTFILGGVRIGPLIRELSFSIYIAFWGSLLIFIFGITLVFGMALRLNDTNSNYYKMCTSITRKITAILGTVMFIPILEIILMMIKCENDEVGKFSESIECWKGLHLLYSVLSVIFTLIFCLFISLLLKFYFNPFEEKSPSYRKSSVGELFFLSFKIIAIFQSIFISNQWGAIVLLIFPAILNLSKGIDNQTYNTEFLEGLISVRNSSILWTYCALFIAKILEETNFNGQIFLLIFGLPLTISISIIYHKKKIKNFLISSNNLIDENETLNKINYLKSLVESFLLNDKNSKSLHINKLVRNDTFLKGYILLHEETCIREHCPLKKYLANSDDFNIQKMSLLHYMDIIFNEAINKFSNSKTLVLNYVQFNYEKNFNMNSAKTFLGKLEKMENNIEQEFIIYCIKENFNNFNKNNKQNNSEDEKLRLEDIISHKFKRFRLLIETSTKLYGEFWGILSNNLGVGNKLNLQKLFSIGNKLNQILNEINILWETDLKMRKIDIESQSVVQLYAYFLKEILKNKKKSEEISKKINNEQSYEKRKTDNDKLDLENLDSILENENIIMYSRTEENGECRVIQISNSTVNALGYSKQDLIGKKIETIMPSSFQKSHYKNLSHKIKILRSSYGNNKELYSAKKKFFVLPKNKNGYLAPMYAYFKLYNEDDFANTFIIRNKFEPKDSKSTYAFYIFTKDDFTVDSISSSCIHLGLSLELLKKYIIPIKYLIQTTNKHEIFFEEQYIEYEEEPKKVTWIFPDILFPKDKFIDLSNLDEFEIEEKIRKSEKKEMYLQITRAKFQDNKTIGFAFRLANIEVRKQNQENIELKLNFGRNKVFLFDLHKLNYSRNLLVEEKDKTLGIRFYDPNKYLEAANENPDNFSFTENKVVENEENKKAKKKEKKKRKKDKDFSSVYSSDLEKEISENILTVGKVNEIQGKSANEVKSFIDEMYNFGDGISFYKRDTEFKNSYEYHYNKLALIKQNSDLYYQHLKERMDKLNSDKKSKDVKRNSFSQSNTNMEMSQEIGSYLNEIFEEKSITKIKLFSFIIFILLSTLISVEFFISIRKINQSKDKIIYAEKSFSIMNSLLYTKFFLTEAVLAQNKSYTNSEEFHLGNNTNYIIDLMSEMSEYHKKITDTYISFSNATISFNDLYYEHMDSYVFQRILSNGIPSTNLITFSSMISLISTTIFDISNVNNNLNEIVMTQRNTYDLMTNILNDYFTSLRKLTFILVDDVYNRETTDLALLIIFILSFIIAVISLLVMKRLIGNFIEEREKPIDLFLTIKKNRFEELKLSTEAFLNKLLNKFFGNEENEDENLSISSSGINSDEINITKFQLKNDYKQSKSSSEYLLISLRIGMFLAIFLAYMTFKYFYVIEGFERIRKFSYVFNSTQYSQSDIVLSTNIIKQYFYNNEIPIFNTTQTDGIYNDMLIDVSEKLQETIHNTYLNMNYMEKNYIDFFYSNLNEDICNLSTSIKNNVNCDELFLGTLNYGFKGIINRYYELIRYLGYLKYKNVKDFDFLNSKEFGEIRWYNNQLKNQMQFFNDYIEQINLITVSIFIILFVTIIIMYLFVWKNFEENLKKLLSSSVNLINLIPESIKSVIAQKFIEEGNEQKE